MERIVKKVFLFCISGFLISLSTHCQTVRSGILFTTLPVESGEKIRLFTDRSIYCVNEKIYFTADYSFINEFDTLNWSSVLYVELIRWNGIKLVQMKLKLTKAVTSGSLELPGNILSGNYYLRAYTKWMRNFSALDYTYIPVKVVNPLRSEKDEGPAETSILNGTTVNLTQKNLFNGVSCIISKNEYRPGEKILVDLSTDNKNISDIDRYCVSVAKVGTIDTAIQVLEPPTTPPERNISDVEYLPEIRGFTISGKVIDISTRLPVNDVLVSLSETQNGEYFSVYKTNNKGWFIFSLPDMMGKHDFFIQAESHSEIFIDNDFCDRPVKLPFIPFTLKEDEINRVNEMAINMQLSQRFLLNKDTATDPKPMKALPIAFYGSKRAVYKTGKYIELPNIEEFISDIILEAEIKSKKGKVFLSIRKKTTVSNDDPPLILLDNVQVNNDDLLLKTPLNRIERVEAINMDYVVAGMKYGGIIGIYSKNKDFAGLDLNKNSMFFTYELFSDRNPGYDYNKRSNNSRIPDRRNLLYWNPDIQLSADKKTTISFYTSDSKGDYVVYIRGKNSKDNREIYGKCYFSVK